MKLLTDTWRQLVQRRLWPVALLLLGALVAVPFVLGKDPEPAAPVATAAAHAPATGGEQAADAASDPIVSMVSEDTQEPTRRSLGVRHNPFASSAPKKKVKKAKTVKVETAQSPSSSSTSQSQDSSSGAGSGGSSAPTTPAAPKQPTETVPAQSIVVRFGSSSDDNLPKTRLARNEALSTADPSPIVVYLGSKNNGKTAIFMVSEGYKAVGDGKCVPADTCEKIELNVGDTEFFQAQGDADKSEWEVDLVKIYRHATKVPVDNSLSAGAGAGSNGSSALE